MARNDRTPSGWPLPLAVTGVFIFLLSCAPLSHAAAQKLAASGGANNHPHNLSSISTNTIKATETDQICIFCHAPHNASTDGPLWNRPDITTALGGGNFPLYGHLDDLLIDNIPASTYGDGVTQYPNGATRLCLSCHDGVTAIGTVLSARGGGNLSPTLDTMNVESPTMVIDLATSHPVSFTYDATVIAALNDPSTGKTGSVVYSVPSPGILDDQQRVQCTACHDPHLDTNDGASYFLPMWRNYTGTEDVDYNNTCTECHVGGATSAGLVNKSLTYPTHDIHSIP